ncbi:MAG: type II secretion system protein [Candidatus Eisenbacteria bacterium]|nr:type II secretion system protein [Candidatus Eisenbacteria bacterium]
MRRTPGLNLLSEKRGFTLVEICVSFLLMALFFAGLAQSFPLALKLVVEGKLRNEAAALAQGKMEELKSYGYGSGFLISGSDEVRGKYRRSWNVTQNSPVPRMNEIVVTVSWNLGSKERTLEFRNYVAQ